MEIQNLVGAEIQGHERNFALFVEISSAWVLKQAHVRDDST